MAHNIFLKPEPKRDEELTPRSGEVSKEGEDDDDKEKKEEDDSKEKETEMLMEAQPLKGKHCRIT
jgi:hypothetical protein